MDASIKLRHELHRNPELSGAEKETASRISRFFQSLNPDADLNELGGTGCAFIFSGRRPGPTVLLRAELDALPIHEAGYHAYRSKHQGISHKCGHDGHMAILAAVGQWLASERPAKGRVVLLFQPAEETGTGAAAVIGDPRFNTIAPDYAFALHNLPGFPFGRVIVRNGSFSSASRGATIQLHGTSAHAAQPETGRSPAPVLAELIQKLSQLPASLAAPKETAFVTVVGARLGEKAFGTAPDSAELWATLRSETDSTMEKIFAYVEDMTRDSAAAEQLNYSISYSDIFAATINSPAATDIVRHSASEQPLELEQPFRWSEDFGAFTKISSGALFGIGAGQDVPDLHCRDYDFPDKLVVPATEVFKNIIRFCLH